MNRLGQNLPGLRAAGLIVAGLMVAPSAPLGWAEYIRANDDDMRWCASNVKTAAVGSSASRRREETWRRAVPAERRVLI